MRRPPYLYAGTLTALLAASLPAFGTTILSIQSDEALFVAADSKVVAIEGEETWLCKIVVAPNHVFTAAGLLKDTWGTYNIFDIARRAINGGGTLDQVISRFEIELRVALVPILATTKSQNPIHYNAKVKNKPAIQTLFAATNGATIRSIYTAFTPEEPDTPISVTRRTCPGDCKNPHLDLLIMGDREGVERELRREPKIWQRLGVQGSFNRLITIQSQTTPATVGLPISIVRLLRDGRSNWEQQGNCN